MNSPDAMISVALGLSKGTVSIPFFFGARLDADIRFLDLPPELAAEAGAPPATPTIHCSATAEEPTALASRYCATALCRHSRDRSRMSLEMFRRPSTKASSRLRPPFVSARSDWGDAGRRTEEIRYRQVSSLRQDRKPESRRIDQGSHCVVDDR